MDRKAWAVAALTLLFTVLQYVDPDRQVLTVLHLPAVTIRSLDVFGLLASLGVIVLLVMGFRRLGRVNERAGAALDTATEVGKKIVGLEGTMLETVNKTGTAINGNLRAAS